MRSGRETRSLKRRRGKGEREGRREGERQGRKGEKRVRESPCNSSEC